MRFISVGDFFRHPKNLYCFIISIFIIILSWVGFIVLSVHYTANSRSISLYRYLCILFVSHVGIFSFRMSDLRRQVMAISPVYCLQVCYGMSSAFPAILTPQLTQDCALFTITDDQESWIGESSQSQLKDCQEGCLIRISLRPCRLELSFQK